MGNFVGSREIIVRDESKDISFPALILYPTAVPEKPVAYGPYLLNLSADAPVESGPWPVVIVSHGNGGTHLGYRTLAMHLAKNGFVVALPEHHGNNRKDNSLERTLENLELRPRHIRLTIDALALEPVLGNEIQSENVAIVGHSMGGYSALAVAGGQPWWCPERKIEVIHDQRVKALILMASANAWYVPNDSLKSVKIPILLYAGEHDVITPYWQAQLVLDLVPNRKQVTFQMVKNAGHFSFMSPFPTALKHIPPALDPAGFDREKFQEELKEEIRLFLNKFLKAIP